MTHRDTSYDESSAPRPERLRLRIGDAERNQAIDDLGGHLAAGRLTLDEYEQRLDQVVGAKTAGDLHPVFEDLPGGVAAAGPTAAAAHRPATSRQPHRRPTPVVAWALASPWVMVNTLMVLIWATTGAGYFWPIWVMGPWGLAILPGVLGSSRRSRSRRPRTDEPLPGAYR